jgi:hypothetical protein
MHASILLLAANLISATGLYAAHQGLEPMPQADKPDL